jgi:Na+/melibiose symporter-like transporter
MLDTAAHFRAITYGGPLLSVMFLLFWFEWTSYTSLQFAFCLIMYDGVLSYLDVNHSALLADLASTEEERATYTMYTAIFSCLGSASVFASFAVWDLGEDAHFQTLCLGLAAFCAIGFYFSGQLLK